MKPQLQKRTLNQYQEAYPGQTLKEISMTTGINLSRVFRLFNGYEMKVSELETFELSIQRKKKTSLKYSSFLELAEQCYLSLKTPQLKTLIEDMQQNLYCFPQSQSQAQPKGA